MTNHIERFAPSPTGLLHLGHAYSALLAYEAAQRAGGRFLLRIEDIDMARSKPAFEQAIYDDLHWLGINWEEPVLKQSSRLNAYAHVLDVLKEKGVLYPCFCSRTDIKNALSAPQEGAPMIGPDGLVYPGICRDLKGKCLDKPHLWRLDMRKATGLLKGKGYFYKEVGEGARSGHRLLDIDFLINGCGDVALARKDTPTSYHLSVVVDDMYQGITHVTRGEDLREATQIHLLLQLILDMPTPVYHHHGLIRDDMGKRLAKRDDARSIAKYRAEGACPQDIKAMIGL